MSDRPPADRTARLLLRYFREPSRFRAEALQPDAPRLDGAVVLKLALGHRIEFAEAALNRLSVSVLRDAAASYVRRMYFRADATPYQTLGVAPDATPEAIKDNFRLLMQLVHPDRQDARARWPESCAAQANRAHGVLRNEESRAAFDREEAERVRAAAAQAARGAVAVGSAGPGGRWGEGGYAARRSPERTLLPAWLTGAVAGFVRAHPAPVAFSVLIGGAALVIGATLWDGEAASLTREERLARAPDRAPAAAPAPALSPTPAPTPVSTPAPTPVPASASTAAPTAVPASAPTAVPAFAATATAAPVAVTASPVTVPAVASGPPPAPRVVPVAPPPVAAAPEPRVDVAAPAAVASVAAIAPAAPVAPAPAAPAAAAKSAPPTAVPPPRAEPAAPAAEATTPTIAEIETLFATFVESYDRGRLDAFSALFDDDAESNQRRGRAAIRDEYDELFRLSSSRRMQLTRINWKRAGERAYAKGEIAVRINWRDGREVDQRIAVDMEMAHRDGRLVITRLSHQARTP